MDVIVDFDGTCVTHDYPRVGRDIGAVPVLKKLVSAGHRLILFTMRSEQRGISPVTGEMQDGGLADAINWFKENDIPLFGIQTNPTQKAWTSSPKAYGQLILDDTAFGCPLIFDVKMSNRPFINWSVVEAGLIEMNLIK
jgi:hypothetical protein